MVKRESIVQRINRKKKKGKKLKKSANYNLAVMSLPSNGIKGFFQSSKTNFKDSK
jgi:hypothetical protein